MNIRVLGTFRITDGGHSLLTSAHSKENDHEPNERNANKAN